MLPSASSIFLYTTSNKSPVASFLTVLVVAIANIFSSNSANCFSKEESILIPFLSNSFITDFVNTLTPLTCSVLANCAIYFASTSGTLSS